MRETHFHLWLLARTVWVRIDDDAFIIEWKIFPVHPHRYELILDICQRADLSREQSCGEEHDVEYFVYLHNEKMRQCGL